MTTRDDRGGCESYTKLEWVRAALTPMVRAICRPRAGETEPAHEPKHIAGMIELVALDRNQMVGNLRDARRELAAMTQSRDEARQVNADRYDEIRELASKVAALTERPGSVSEARAAFVDAMATPQDAKPSCHGCEHRAEKGLCTHEQYHAYGGGGRTIAMAPGAPCPCWCPLLEGAQ